MKKELQVYLDQYKADYILGYTEGANILLTNPKTKHYLTSFEKVERHKIISDEFYT